MSSCVSEFFHSVCILDGYKVIDVVIYREMASCPRGTIECMYIFMFQTHVD